MSIPETSVVINEVENQTSSGGLVKSITGTWPGTFGYAGAFGYEEDADSGLKLLGNRYYDTSLGRFLSRDPIKDDSNWYSYCGANPISNSDPEGSVKIKLLWREVIAGACHAYLLVTDNQVGSSTFGKSWSISGGPASFAPNDLVSPIWDYGEVVSYSALFQPGQQDFHIPIKGALTFVDDQTPLKPWLDKFSEAEQRLRHRMHYRPMPTADGGPFGNSNTWVSDVIFLSGLQRECDVAWRRMDDKPWLPGWNRIPNKTLNF